MSFTVEQYPSGVNTQDEVDSSMYASASDNDHLVKEISKLEMEKRQHEQEVEQLKMHNKKLVDSYEALEKKLGNLEEEKMAEVRRLEKQIEYMADQQSRIEKSAMEEKLNISSKLEEKNEETLTMQAALDDACKELEYCKLLVKEKEELLEEQMIEFKKQELINNELMGIQEAIVKEKDALLDSQAKSIVELTNKLKMSTENVENERSQKSTVESDKQILEENLKKLMAELCQTKATCEHLKLNFEKHEKDKLDRLQSVNQEKELELSRLENKMRQQLVELQSTISSLRDEKVQLTSEKSSLSDTINKLRIEIGERTAQISDLELSVTDFNNKLLDINEQHCAMEKSYKNQLAEKEQAVAELNRLQESLNERLEAETNKLRKSEQKIDKLMTVLKEHKENEVQLKEKIAELEADIEDSNKKIDSLTSQLKDAKVKVSSVDETQTRIESDISLTKETKNKEVELLSSQLKECKEKSEAQARKIIQHKNDILLIKETKNKEVRERESVITEKQRTIEKLKEENSALGINLIKLVEEVVILSFQRMMLTNGRRNIWKQRGT